MKHIRGGLTRLLLALFMTVSLLPGSVRAADAGEQLYYGCSTLTEPAERAAYGAMVEGVAAGQTRIDLRRFGLKADRMPALTNLLRYDHPEFYELNSSIGWSMTMDDDVLSLNVSYMTDMDRAAFDRAAEKLLQVTWGKTTDYEKALALHDALVKHTAYDSNAPHAHSAYGAIAEGKAVCEGYARAYQYLLQRMGIQSFIATGFGNGGAHAWNLVRLEGKYYYTDVTWDDPLMNIPEESKPIRYRYFNVTEEELLEDHSFDDRYLALKPEADSTEQKYGGETGTALTWDFAKIIESNPEGLRVKLSSRLQKGWTVVAAAYDGEGRMLQAGTAAVPGSGEVEEVLIPGGSLGNAVQLRLFLTDAGGVPMELSVTA